MSPEQCEQLRQSSIRYYSSQEARDKASVAALKRLEDPEQRALLAQKRVMAAAALLNPQARENQRVAVIASNKRRADARGPKGPPKKYYIPVPPGARKKTGPKKGTPRQDRRGFHTEIIRGIRSDYAAGLSYLTIARKYDSDTSTIFKIVKRKTYADIE